MRDIQIICVCGDSPDGSQNILQEYADRDSRIQVIDKPNEGYGKTMNHAIESASGEYIGIVEPGDWITQDFYETLYSIAKKHDIEVVKSRSIRFDDKPMPECDTERAVFYVQPSIWSAIYKREFLNANGIRFLETPDEFSRDTSFNTNVWAKANRVYFETMYK